jgi:hypothetical protein
MLLGTFPSDVGAELACQNLCSGACVAFTYFRGTYDTMALRRKCYGRTSTFNIFSAVSASARASLYSGRRHTVCSSFSVVENIGPGAIVGDISVVDFDLLRVSLSFVDGNLISAFSLLPFELIRVPVSPGLDLARISVAGTPGGQSPLDYETVQVCVLSWSFEFCRGFVHKVGCACCMFVSQSYFITISASDNRTVPLTSTFVVRVDLQVNRGDY